MNSEILKVEHNYKYLESAVVYYSSKLKEVLSVEDFDKSNNYVEEIVIKQKSKMIKGKKLNDSILRKFGT